MPSNISKTHYPKDPPLPPPFNVFFESLKFHVSFTHNWAVLHPGKEDQFFVTCIITCSEPIAFYCGIAVMNPKDEFPTGGYWEFAKLAMKRAVYSMTLDHFVNIGDQKVIDYIARIIYRDFRIGLRQEAFRLQKENEKNQFNDIDQDQQNDRKVITRIPVLINGEPSTLVIDKDVTGFNKPEPPKPEISPMKDELPF